MESQAMVLVDPGTFFGMLRYAILALLIILTVYLLHKSHDWRKTWPGMLSLVVTVIAAPFLIFDFVTPAKPTYTPEPEQQQEPVPDPIPEPEPEPEPTPIPEPEKEEEDEPTPANNVTPSVAPQPSKPSSKPSVKPTTAKPTEPDTPETPDTPEEPEEPTKEKHEITISDAAISSKDKSGKYPEGEEIEITANAKQGYTFDYWSSNDDTLNNRSENPLAFTMPDKAVTISPVYKANEYTIIYDKNANDATGEVANQSQNYDQNIIISDNNYSRNGYDFAEWNTQANGQGTSYAPGSTTKNLSTSGSITLYAIWLKGIKYAEIANRNIELEIGANETITINNAAELTEGYSFSSNNPAIASVNANGTITGVSEGETTITLTGEKSGDIETVSVKILPALRTITFVHWEGKETSAQIRDGETLGTEFPGAITREHYIYKNWYTSSAGGEIVDANTVVNGDASYYAQWLGDLSHATLSSDSITLTNGESAALSVSANIPIEGYSFESSDDTVASIDENGAITTHKAGVAVITVSGKISDETKTATVTVNPRLFMITFDYNDGTGDTEVYNDVAEGTKINPLPTRDRARHNLAGWFTAAEGGEEFTADTTVDGSATYYAHWEDKPVPTVCKAATTLHHATCTDGGCNTTDSMKNGTTITYGKKPTDQSPVVGDAYDCDVNNDGVFDSEKERFYYLSGDNNTASLILYSGYEGSAGAQNVEIFPYSAIASTMPNRDQWKHPFIDVIRIPSKAEVKASCGNNDAKVVGCRFLFEGSRYESTSTGRTAIWLEKDQTVEYYDRMNTKTGAFEKKYESDNSKNAIRPIIDIPREGLETVAPKPKRTITFNTMGGDALDPIQITEDSEIGALPTPFKEKYDFIAWSTTDDGNSPIDETYIVTGDTVLYAVWEEITGVIAAVYDPVTNKPSYKESLSVAVSAAKNNVKTTVHLLGDTTEKITISSAKDVILDLQGHTLNNDNSNAIVNNGILTVQNGTVTCSAGSGAIDNASTGTLTLTDVEVSATYSRQAVYNNGGTVYVLDGTALSSTADQRATLHNLANGTTYILGGTITSTGAYAVFNQAGTVNIGDHDGLVDTSKPIITGKTYGAISQSIINVYDGIIRGETSAIGRVTKVASNIPTIVDDLNSQNIIGNIEDDSEVDHDTQSGYVRLYLVQTTSKIQITFDANGGTVTETSRTIDANTAIGELPNDATRSRYRFIGWFTDPENGTQINADTIPDQTTYYAHWESTADEIVEHYTASEAAKSYFTSATSWDTSESNYLTELKNNYNSHSCKNTGTLDVSNDFGYSYSNGSNYCDRQTPYDTGITDNLIVRISNEETKIKNGAVASYVDTTNGKITNMIPGETYYWESASDSSIYGYVKATGERRFITLDTTRNVRDLGGLASEYGGKIKYGRIMRGESIKTAADKSGLEKLGVTVEYETRDSDDGPVQFDSDKRRKVGMIHYNIKNDGTTSIQNSNKDNYTLAREAVVSAMNDLIAGENIYIHCSHGADRTGTLAYLLEGLLGISQEDRYTDYELTTLAGQSDRTRYYHHKGTSGSDTDKFVWNRKFIFMTSDPNGPGLVTNSDIYNWFMSGSTDPTADEALITTFRNAVLE